MTCCSFVYSGWVTRISTKQEIISPTKSGRTHLRPQERGRVGRANCHAHKAEHPSVEKRAARVQSEEGIDDDGGGGCCGLRCCFLLVVADVDEHHGGGLRGAVVCAREEVVRDGVLVLEAAGEKEGADLFYMYVHV